MTTERLQMEAIRLSRVASEMVERGEITKTQAGWYLRDAVRELIELKQKLENQQTSAGTS